MARTITDEEIKLSIIINGNPAQKQLLDLEKATRRLTEENKSLILEKKRLETQGLKESAQYKEITAKIKSNNLALSENKNAMKELQNQIGVTGLTMAQLTQKATLLKMTLRNLVPGSADYVRYQQELKQVTTRIGELNGKAAQSGLSIGKIADGFNRYAALGASVIGFFAGMVVSVQKVIDLNGKLSDAQSNVMKTTGMTKREVDELTKSFGALKTRTARIDLLGIAEVGGRLGIAKEEIGSFIKVMDKASVALGDSFEGGPQVVADKLGKIKGLYDELKNSNVESAFESVGSALNDLGASGTASEQNVAEFVTRVGSLPNALKPSIQGALGLGAAFEESGLKAEVAASNYGKIISIAARDFKQFAQVMGLPAEKVKEMINTDPTQFFLDFSNSLKGLDATELAEILDYLKLNDNEVKMVLGAAAENTQLFVDKMQLAKNSMLDATSLTNEFNIKNENLAATLEKIKKKITGWFSSDEFVIWLEKSVKWFADLIGATDKATNKSEVFKNTMVVLAKFLAIITAALVTKVAWQKLAALWDTKQAFLTRTLTNETAFYSAGLRVRAVLDNITLLKTQAMTFATSLWRLQLNAAALSLRAMGTTMMAMPWGAILMTIGVLYATYQAFSNEVEEANDKMKMSNDIMQAVNDQTSKQKEGIKLLIGVMNDENATREQKEKALERLKSATDGYLESLTLENFHTRESQNLINDYIKSIDKLAEAKAILEIKTKLITERIESENKTKALTTEKKGTKNTGNSWLGDDGKFFGLGERNQIEIQTEIEAEKANTSKTKMLINSLEARRQAEISALRKDIKIKTDEMNKLSKDSQTYKRLKLGVNSDYKVLNTLLGIGEAEDSYNGKYNSSAGNVPTNKKGGTGNKNTEKKYDYSYLDDELKRKEELYQAEKKAEEDRITLLKDGYDKELRLENLHHQDKLHQTELKNEQLKLIENKLNRDLLEAQKGGDSKKVDSLKIQLGLIKQEKIKINDQLESAEQLHQQKIGIIQEKAGLQEVEKLKEKYDQEKLVRETAFLNELDTLNLSAEEKAKRKKQFDEEESKRLAETFNNQIVLLDNMINDVDFSGIDFSLLTPEKEAELKKQIEKLQNALAKIKEAKDGIAGNSDKEISLGLGTQTDILGFSQEQWNNFYKNIDSGKIGIETMAFAVFALKNAFVEVDKLIAQSEAVKLKNYEKTAESRKKSFKRQLDAGIINQDQYNKRVEKIDEDLDNKKFAIELKQAKRQKLIGAMNVLQSTAQAIMGIWAQVPKFDFGISAGILTGIVGGIGAIQLASVLKAPLPTRGAEEGYYPNLVRREQDNKLFRTTGTSKMKSGLFTKPRLLVGEGPGDMPEMVIDKKAFAQISPETKSALLREISAVKGFENGYYNKGTFNTGTTPTSSSSNNGDEVVQLIKMALAVVAKNTEVMEDIKENGLAAFVSNKDMPSMKNIQKGMKEYNELISKSKV